MSSAKLLSVFPILLSLCAIGASAEEFPNGLRLTCTVNPKIAENESVIVTIRSNVDGKECPENMVCAEIVQSSNGVSSKPEFARVSSRVVFMSRWTVSQDLGVNPDGATVAIPGDLKCNNTAMITTAKVRKAGLAKPAFGKCVTSIDPNVEDAKKLASVLADYKRSCGGNAYDDIIAVNRAGQRGFAPVDSMNVRYKDR